MSYEEIGIRMRADGVVEATNGVALTGKAVEQLGAKLDDAARQGANFDASSRQAGAGAQAMGSAASVLTGELANGLHLPGAMGAALQSMGARGGRAMGGMAGSASLAGGAFLGLAAVSAVLVAAYAKGSAEADAYTKALVLTGNAAGTTRDQLADMARQQGEVVGTQRQAAAALAAMAGTGAVARAQLAQGAELAVRMERELGQSVQDTARIFEQLGRDPVRASAKLNEQHNYLTITVYEQIKALQEQGRYSEAAAAAQTAYADVMSTRMKALEGNLGTFERAWRSVGETAAWAWDKILNVGRESTPQQAVDKLQQQIESYEAELAIVYERGDTKRAAVLEAELQKRREMQSVLQSDLRLAQSAATAQAQQAAAVRERIKADEDAKRGRGGAGADPYARLNDQIARRLSLAQAELAAGGQLSDADRFRVDMLREIDEAEKKLGTTRAARLRTDTEAAAAVLRDVAARRAAAKEAADIERAFQADRQAATRAAYQQTEQLVRERDALAAETEELGLNAAAVHWRRQAVLDAQIADKEARIQRIAGLPAYTEETVELQRQVAVLREMRNLRGDAFTKKTKIDEKAEYERRTNDLAKSIEDGFVNGFREGRSLSDIFFNELKAQAARTILKIPIQAMAQGGNSIIEMILRGMSGMMGGGVNLSGNTGPAMDAAYDMGPVVPAMATGTNYVPRNMLAFLHEGESVTPKEYNPAAGGTGGGTTLHFSPQINVDSRTDKAEVLGIIGTAMRQAQAQLLEMMARKQV